MDYSIRELSELAGVSARTLRYYDEMDLLRPKYVSDAGYRFYGSEEVTRLQQILFYRERGFELKKIRRILNEKEFDLVGALEEHLQDLEAQKVRTEFMIDTVRKTLASMKGECEMSDKAKFEVFKKNLVKENEMKYGAEIREKYGAEQVDAANQKLLSMTSAEYEQFQKLESEIYFSLMEGVKKDISPEGEEAKKIYELHREWLMKTWKQYTPEAHRGLAAMYLADERFRLYYDKEVEGCAELLVSAVNYWAGKR